MILAIGHIGSPHSWSHWTLESLCVNASLRYKNLSVGENRGPVYRELNGCLKKYKHNCFIDDHCWNIMTEPGSQQHEISHQLMFIMLADKVSHRIDQIKQTLNKQFYS